MATAGVPNTYTHSISETKEKLRNYMKDDGKDQNWKNRAVGCLGEILRLIEEASGTRGLLELEKAIAWSNSETECVLIALHPSITLTETVNGPHATSYRLWRWPDLPGLIKPIDMHNYEQDPSNFHWSSPHRQGQSICVNPYHYYYDSGDADSTQNVKDRLLRCKKAGGDQLWVDHSTDCLNMVFDLIEIEESRGLMKVKLEFVENPVSNENPEACCIFISIKLSDPRLQVKGEKYIPHVASYKLWRSPDLANSATAIQPVMKYRERPDHFHVETGCRKPSTFCINPFHYEETPEAATIKRLKDFVKKSGSEGPEQNTNDCFDKIISLIDEDIMRKLVIAIDDTKPTECIILKPTATTKRGTFYLNAKEYWPHVVSCRLWRWHNLYNRSDAIQPIAEYEQSPQHHPNTGKPTSKGHPEFELCLNPIHYQKSLYY